MSEVIEWIIAILIAVPVLIIGFVMNKRMEEDE